MIQALRLLPGGRRSENVVALRLAVLLRPPNQCVKVGLTRSQESTLWLPVGGEAYTPRLAAFFGRGQAIVVTGARLGSYYPII